MKRKIDENKVFAFIGRAVVLFALWASTVWGVFWCFENCITIL